jgi:NitT/TauT family transport system substrate-binding protein
MKNGQDMALLAFIFIVAALLPCDGFGQVKIRIGVPLFPTVAFPAFIASEKRFFEKNGLAAEIIRINSEPTTYQALISGSIDVAAGAPSGLIMANVQGVPMVSLGSWDNVVPYTLATRESIDDLSKLKGKKIGVNRLGGKSSLILRVMLEEAGLNPMKDVTLLQLGGSQERLAALMRGGIDAAPVDYAFEPKMKQLGFFLLSGRKTPFMNGSLAVKPASLKADPGKWKRFVKAFSEATQYMMSQKDGTLEVLRRVTQIDDKASLDFIYEQMRSRADVNLRPPAAAVDNLIRMVAYDDKRALSVDRNKLFDLSILNEPLSTNPQK